ncbi:VOC family protein [Haloferax larsenii]|uniref:Glyoxalase/Bleomycin resistance protein/Dioxygenase superfamily protein n=1 Tax=Haloferax larsenii TaxID=302484 RepID=A0A1H7T8A5_HALLR|nr:VOC family protein [Haloferax larsenii]SEL80057.1 Glyoxalase/Bleomycin resistance protein/Dioxygenase superfamily protein [Haloferax larsenii]
MDAQRIDHVHLRIPEDETEHAIEFYQGLLGFPLEGFDEYEADKTPIFHFRLTPDTIIHVRPTDEFVHPERENFDHLAIILDEDIEDVKQELEDAGVIIEREGAPYGATGEAPAIYVRDPFGYLLELKEPVAGTA